MLEREHGIVGDAPGNLDRLAIVEGFKFREFLRVTLDEVRELVNEAGALEAGDVLAPGRLKRRASSGNGNVDVFFGT